MTQATPSTRPTAPQPNPSTMHWDINQQLARMQNLRSSADERAINCATCHRGAIDPHESRR